MDNKDRPAGAAMAFDDISQLGPVELGPPPRTKFGRWARVRQVDLAKLPPVKTYECLRTSEVITIDGRKRGDACGQDQSGRPLPVWQGCRVIGDGEIFLMNPDEPASLDGRYFGPIPIAAIDGTP